MRKRFFFILTALETAALFIAPAAFAQNAPNVRDFATRANVIDGIQGISIVGYFGTEKNVIIPPTIDGIPVTSIGEQAFMLRGLTNVTIPNGIIIIGRQAFYGNQLRNVYIPPSVRTIGESAFEKNNQPIHIEKLRLNTTRTVEIYPTLRRESYITERILPPPLPSKSPSKQAPPEYPKDDNTVSSEVIFELQTPTHVAIIENNRTFVQAAEKPVPESTGNFKIERTYLNSPSALRTRDAGPVTPPDARVVPSRPVSPPVDEGTFFLQANGDGTAAIVGYRGQYNYVSIPQRIGKFTLTSISNSAFFQHRLLRVYIPDSITHISDGAFAGNSLLDIILPESVRYVGYQAFSSNDIRKVTIGAGVNIQSDSIRNNFSDFYNMRGQLAGTYIWNDGEWMFSNFEDVHYYSKKD